MKIPPRNGSGCCCWLEAKENGESKKKQEQIGMTWDWKWQAAGGVCKRLLLVFEKG